MFQKVVDARRCKNARLEHFTGNSTSFPSKDGASVTTYNFSTFTFLQKIKGFYHLQSNTLFKDLENLVKKDSLSA